MAFREKIAWLTLGTMLVAYAAYFGVVGPAAGFGRSGLVDVIWSFGPVAATQALVVLAGSAVLAIAARREARAPADERDRAIARRGSTMGYFVLLAGMILVGVLMPFSEPAWKIVNCALAAIVAAEAVRYAVILLSYRRGWHG